MDTQLARQLTQFAETVSLNRGRAYFVGGYVRDQLLGLESKDLDIEVHGVDPKHVRQIMESHFKEVTEQGEAFGVLSTVVRGEDETVRIDVSLPRTDSKVAPGHTGFAIHVDPHMGVVAAAQRRDFTINAMLQDILTGERIDPYGGMLDLQAGVLRAVDQTLFGDDPLRVLRAVQFVGRFGLRVEPETLALMQVMAPQLQELSSDRKREEWRKLFLSAPKPSLGLMLARELGLFTGPLHVLEQMAHTEQDPVWHPEGSVWAHTVWGCDEVVTLVEREHLGAEDRLALMLGNLCHDMGKVDTTRRDGAHIHSQGHQEAGQVYVMPVLRELGCERYAEAVANMMRFHHHPMWWFGKQAEVRDGQVRSLARHIKPMTLRLLSYLTEVDLRSRGPYPEEQADVRTPEIADWFRSKAEQLQILDGPPEDIIRGADLLRLGLRPGPVFGQIVRVANRVHDEHDGTREQILDRIKRAKDELAQLDPDALFVRLRE